MFIFHFVPAENGELPKISSVKEFVDSAYILKFFAEEQAKDGGHLLKVLSRANEVSGDIN